MRLFNKMKEPVFLKESSDLVVQLEKLKALEPLLNPTGQSKIKRHIKSLEYGIEGENNIAFELKNSHMPMYILHDIYLENQDLSAQIDYLVFTKKICFVIECKNLYGNIEINNSGDFIRTIEFGNTKKKEGIYSPITQSQRHLELMKKMKIDSKENRFIKFIAERYFENYYKSIVVLANPKTILNAKYANKAVKEKVIRADQLVKYIKDAYKQSKEPEMTDEELLACAQSYLKFHKDVIKNYTEKYDVYKIEANEVIETSDDLEEIPIEETNIFKELKAYRLEKSREEKVKPYFIYNDNQLKDLISKMPKTKEQLCGVSGFGETKADKYGDDILKILVKYNGN